MAESKEIEEYCKKCLKESGDEECPLVACRFKIISEEIKKQK